MNIKEAPAAVAKSRRPRVLPDVVRAIAAEVLAGNYPVGSSLPSENDLCTEHGVSRTVIREALKTLAAKGLVLSRPRIGTVVCERDNWNIIDPQVLEWHAPNTLDPKLFDSILETRRAIEPLVAELAATRASLQEIADLELAWKGMEDAGSDVARFARSDAAFHQVLYGACHNPIFRQIGGMIETALNFALEATANSVDRRDEAVRVHYGVVEALRMRDATAARRAANEILDLAARDLARAKSQKKQD
ncbi:FadR/GntR family transcriptional regulator [Aminobacter sp. UC22_36]|uniref:FadR/GntR family transcriptional regulator n=1 Tax=Aminobacter sp. UC22_36 TaxID=3374549 RepID=UPI0037570BEC